jgi:hypothetical protein
MRMHMIVLAICTARTRTRSGVACCFQLYQTLHRVDLIQILARHQKKLESYVHTKPYIQWVTVKIGIKFRPRLFRLYLDRV